MCNHPDCPNPERGKHLKSIEDVKDNPVFNIELDRMPDGYHAKPYRLWSSKPQKRRIQQAATDEEMESTRSELKASWDKLPEPRPDPMDFAAYHTRWEQWFELYKISKSAPLYGDRIKANSVLLDFAKSRPKQQFEITSHDLKNLDNTKLLEEVLELNGLSRDLARQLKSEVKQ